MVVHYFSLSGDWVAFRRDGDRMVFDTGGRPLGWMPWGEGEVVGEDGLYLGTVLGNRLVHRRGTRYRCALGKPVFSRAGDVPTPPDGAAPVAVLPGYEELPPPGTLGLTSAL